MAGKGEREPNPFWETVWVLGSKGSDASVPLLGSTGFPGVVAAEEPVVSVGSVGAETLEWRGLLAEPGDPWACRADSSAVWVDLWAW